MTGSTSHAWLWRRVAVGTVALAAAFGACSATRAAEQSQQSAAANHLLNTRRTGYTPTELAPPYRLVWTHQFRHKPRPAWKEPAWEVQRIDFDYAYAVSAGNGLVYVASSSDHAVHALELGTGEEKWRFFTEGPVRLAPAVHDGRIYFSSDDGFAYCLDGRTGSLVWKHRPNISDERLIGNEQMISRWPARSGVLVDGDRAYTTFGMWSPEGIVVTCLDAITGEAIWINDTCGTRYMTQPHYEAMGGVSPQGYLALAGDVLVVPCGRAAPAFFDTKTGKLLYNEAEGLFPGGAWTMTFGDLAFTPCEYTQKPNPVAPLGAEAPMSAEASLVALKAQTGEEVFHLHGALRGVITDDGTLNLVGPKGLVSVALDEVLKAAPGAQKKVGSSEGHFVEVADHKRWQTPTEPVFELIQAGNTLIAGARGALACYDAKDGRKTWETEVPGDVRELLIARDSLVVSTTEGAVHCFRTGPAGEARVTREAVRAAATTSEASERAAAALSSVGINAGYGIVLGDADASYLAELARQSKLAWCWAAGDREVATVRTELAEAGLHGTRIAVHSVGANPMPYADYLANVVLLRVETQADLARVPASELHRVLRPYGGVAVVECGEALRPAVEKWLADGGVPREEWKQTGRFTRIERGPLPGAGQWTHQYADAGKSGASSDQLVKLPLKTLWFGSLGPGDMVSRHYRGPAPLAIGGHLYVAGIDHVHAVDAYNGRLLWERKLPGVGRWPAAYRGGCVAADAEAVYALQGAQCLRLDRDTGETTRTYEIPLLARRATEEDESVWEHLAVTEDLIIGTYGRANIRRHWWSHAHPANQLLFALDKKTGEARWTYESQSSIDSSALAIDGERLLLIDGRAPADVFTRPRKGQQAKSKLFYSLRGAPHTRLLKALDLQTGRELWHTAEVGARQNSLYAANGVVLSTMPVWHGLRATKEGPSVSAFSAAEGKLLWSRDSREARPPFPVIIGDVAYVPEACDLRTGKLLTQPDPLTGEPVPFTPLVTGGCGRMSGCPGAMLKRSGSLGFFDLRQHSGIYHQGNLRAGCWINMIPACGLVLVPEGSSSCPCAYNYKTSVALMPATRHNHFGVYGGSPRRNGKIVKELRLNFGAPGDRPDENGNLWFAYPRPSTQGPRGAGGMGGVPLDKLPIEVLNAEGELTTVARNPDWTAIRDTDIPWLYTCGLVGPLKLRIRLAPGGAASRAYRATLFFCELNGTASSGRFDVKLQGQTVLSDLRILREAGGTNRSLAKEVSVQAADVLTMELASQGDSHPIISGIRIIAQ